METGPDVLAELLRAVARADLSLRVLSPSRFAQVFSCVTVESADPDGLRDAARVAEAAARSLREEADRREEEDPCRSRVPVMTDARHRIQQDNRT